MNGLPNELKLTQHAKQRLEERKDPEDYYNTKNLMNSSCRWYGKEDLIPESSLYVHCMYVCRKARNKMGYMTDGNIEVLYDKHAGVAITIMEVKEKFLPITQYIKPSVLEQIEIKKENRKMKKKLVLGTCPDCGKDNVEITSQNICTWCRTRKTNAKNRGKEYIPYVELPEQKKILSTKLTEAQSILKKNVTTNCVETEVNNKLVEVNNNKVTETARYDNKLVSILKSCGCQISDDILTSVLNTLDATGKLKDLLLTISSGAGQEALLDLEQMLNVAERKLQHDWEYNGFREEDDIKFKEFLTVRRSLKSDIFFWKKLYQTGTLIELQRAWAGYNADPTDKQTLVGDRVDSNLKRYQITTDTISTILNTRKRFTRVFYATSKEDSHDKFIKWLSERNLHEDPKKTVIVELTNDSETCE